MNTCFQRTTAPYQAPFRILLSTALEIPRAPQAPFALHALASMLTTSVESSSPIEEHEKSPVQLFGAMVSFVEPFKNPPILLHAAVPTQEYDCMYEPLTTSNS